MGCSPNPGTGGCSSSRPNVDVATVEAVQAKVRKRGLTAYHRRGWLEAEAAQAMAQWNHGGGFSVDVSMRIEGNDR